MKKWYLRLSIVLSLCTCAFLASCEKDQAKNLSADDQRLISDLSVVQKGDFVQLYNGRLLVVHDITCEKANPLHCRLKLKAGYESELMPYPLEWWAPQVEKITHYADPTWKILAYSYIANNN